MKDNLFLMPLPVFSSYLGVLIFFLCLPILLCLNLEIWICLRGCGGVNHSSPAVISPTCATTQLKSIFNIGDVQQLEPQVYQETMRIVLSCSVNSTEDLQYLNCYGAGEAVRAVWRFAKDFTVLQNKLLFWQIIQACDGDFGGQFKDRFWIVSVHLMGPRQKRQLCFSNQVF